MLVFPALDGTNAKSHRVAEVLRRQVKRADAQSCGESPNGRGAGVRPGGLLAIGCEASRSADGRSTSCGNVRLPEVRSLERAER
jgi:hypothetical protein